MRKLSTISLLLLLLATSVGATECGQAVEDSGFDSWCGDSLCRWKLEAGGVERAPTWHPHDTGVALVGEDVAISQLSEVSSMDGLCVAFDLVADVAENAEVRVQMDVYGDGTYEHDERLPTSAWRALRYRVRMPDFYQGVRFRVTKRGGRAVLANLGVSIVEDGECAAEPLVAGPRPYGVRCTEDAQCGSGACYKTFFNSGVCSACRADAECGAGKMCGVVPAAEAHLGLWATCVALGSAPANAACNQDAQCATGTCDGGACGVCDDNADCGGGGSCQPAQYSIERADAAPALVNGALHCTGGTVKVARGGACIVDGDCASGACRGEAQGFCATSLVPRRCTQDSECPGSGYDAAPACVTVGTSGGVCQ